MYLLRTNYPRGTLSRFSQVRNCRGMNIRAPHRRIVSKYFEEKEKVGAGGALRREARRGVSKFPSLKFLANQVLRSRRLPDFLEQSVYDPEERERKAGGKLEVRNKCKEQSRYFFYFILSRRLLRER